MKLEGDDYGKGYKSRIGSKNKLKTKRRKYLSSNPSSKTEGVDYGKGYKSSSPSSNPSGRTGSSSSNPSGRTGSSG